MAKGRKGKRIGSQNIVETGILRAEEERSLPRSMTGAHIKKVMTHSVTTSRASSHYISCGTLTMSLMSYHAIYSFRLSLQTNSPWGKTLMAIKGYLLSSKNAAHLLDLSPDKVSELAQRKKLSAKKVGRLWKYNVKDVMAYKRKQERERIATKLSPFI
jgi:excisionase family DNA binding protein